MNEMVLHVEVEKLPGYGGLAAMFSLTPHGGSPVFFEFRYATLLALLTDLEHIAKDANATRIELVAERSSLQEPWR